MNRTVIVVTDVMMRLYVTRVYKDNLPFFIKQSSNIAWLIPPIWVTVMKLLYYYIYMALFVFGIVQYILIMIMVLLMVM